MNLVVALVLGIFSAKQDEAKEKIAELNARGLMAACEAYYINPSSGLMYPKTLTDLVVPPFGGSLLKNGAKDLLDPWGKEYKYAAAVTDKGIPAGYVWTERVVNGKTKVYGRKPPDKKQ
jgi:hypothetical protein